MPGKYLLIPIFFFLAFSFLLSIGIYSFGKPLFLTHQQTRVMIGVTPTTKSEYAQPILIKNIPSISNISEYRKAAPTKIHIGSFENLRISSISIKITTATSSNQIDRPIQNIVNFDVAHWR